MTEIYHIPVLLKESIDGMDIHPDSQCIDVTFGGGGHSSAILLKLGSKGHLYSFDQDADAIANIKPDKKFTFIRGNFKYIKNFMKYYNCVKVDSILADLGVSSHHFDEKERGFSFRYENSLLDMRMNKEARITASEILNTYSENKLSDLFYKYGELRQSRKIASRIVAQRNIAPYTDVKSLLATLQDFTPKNDKEKKILAQAFQALRMEVNHETEALEEMLQQSLELLKPGGRLVVITYHSIEDRIVKNFIKTGNLEGNLEKDFFGNINTPFISINNKVIIPSQDEQSLNPRSRSAKLRIAEKR